MNLFYMDIKLKEFFYWINNKIIIYYPQITWITLIGLIIVLIMMCIYSSYKKISYRDFD